jgi:hypothetical protein
VITAAASKVAELCSISEKLFDDKRVWDQLCQDLAENYYPLRADFTTTGSWASGAFASSIMDSTPVNSREELGNAIGSMLRQGEWFKMGTGDEDRDSIVENARSLDRGTKLLRGIIRDPRCNFQPATKEADHDYVTFGAPVLSVEENLTRDFTRVRAWHPGDCAWERDDDGEVNVMHRKFIMTARNAKALHDSGKWNGELHDSIVKACEREPNKAFKFLSIVMPVDGLYGWDAKTMRTFGKNKYVSIYIDVENKVVVHERGEPMFPYIVPRWVQLGRYPWGFSPASMNAISDSRYLQTLAMIILEQGEKALDPPMVGSAEIFTRDVNLYSGGFTYVDLPSGAKLGDMMTTVQTSEGLQAGLELKADARALIVQSFLLNKLFLPQAGGDMRELEVAVRTEEFRRSALPFFNPIETDYHPRLLGKVFERAVLIGQIDGGMFPADLADQDVRFTFNSPLNEAEGKLMVEKYNIVVSTVATGAQIDQTVPSILNIRKATEDAIKGLADPTWLYTGKEKKTKDAEAAQEAAFAKAAQIANQGSLAASNVAAAKGAVEGAGLV